MGISVPLASEREINPRGFLSLLRGMSLAGNSLLNQLMALSFHGYRVSFPPAEHNHVHRPLGVFPAPAEKTLVETTVKCKFFITR